MGDNDQGEQFYNYWLHPDLRPYTGLDLTPLLLAAHSTLPMTKIWQRFVKPPMGCKPAPYQSVQGTTRAREFVLGDPTCDENVFAWSHVDVNLPAWSPRLSTRPTMDLKTNQGWKDSSRLLDLR
jgi:hypothetical protein